MTETSKTKLLTRLQQHRKALKDPEFPIYDSLIGYNLFLLLCHYEMRGLTPRLKDVYVELGRSQGGVRRVVRSLVRDGWITISKAEGDQRSREVIPTPKLKRAIARFVNAVSIGS